MRILCPARRGLSLAVLLVLLLAACTPLPGQSTPALVAKATAALPPPATATIPAASAPAPTLLPAAADTAVPTATLAPPPAATLAPSPTNRPDPLRLSTVAGVPQAALQPVLAALLAAGVQVEAAPDTGNEDLRLVGPEVEDAAPAWEKVFSLAAPMSSVLDSVPLTQLIAGWTGSARPEGFANLYASGETIAELTGVLGQPGPNVKMVAEDVLSASLWADPQGLALVPFEDLGGGLRALKVDGQTPVDNRFQGEGWPLTVRVRLLNVSDRGRWALPDTPAGLPVTNRDPSKLTVLIMTGVTAMARHSAGAIERSGDPGFLARIVGPELAAADITIISNEIPFTTNCQPDERANALVLCSKYEYWENLALSGVDVIGLSGNHLNDFGRKELLGTLAFYREKKVPYYGGGANAGEALAPLILEHNGNQLGFLAANQHGPVVAWAGAETPGSARFDLKTMQAEIQVLKPQVDLVFAEVQHLETNYQGEYVNIPNSGQEYDFKGLNDAGADVVTGVMAHAPQAVELRNGRLILYGLGNLYFDQTWSWPTRTGLVARHTIYDGRLLNTELLVTVIEMNWQLRWATPEERAQVLKSIFAVSRWSLP